MEQFGNHVVIASPEIVRDGRDLLSPLFRISEFDTGIVTLPDRRIRDLGSSMERMLLFGEGIFVPWTDPADLRDWEGNRAHLSFAYACYGPVSERLPPEVAKRLFPNWDGMRDIHFENLLVMENPSFAPRILWEREGFYSAFTDGKIYRA